MAIQKTEGSRTWEGAWSVAQESHEPHEVHFALHQLTAHAVRRSSEDDWRELLEFVADTLEKEPILIAPGVLYDLHQTVPDEETKRWLAGACMTKGVTIGWFQRQMAETQGSRRTRAKRENRAEGRVLAVAGRPNVRWPHRAVTC